MKQVWIVAAAALLTIGVLGVLAFTRSDNAGPPADRAGDMSSTADTRPSLGPVPDFSFPDYEGNLVTKSDLIGRPAVLNVWATWCPFCVDELPHFAAVQQEFGDQVTIVAINRAEPVARARSFTDELGISDQLIWLMDSHDSFYRAIGGFSMPETLFVNANGDIVKHKRGPLTEDQLRAEVLILTGGGN